MEPNGNQDQNPVPVPSPQHPSKIVVVLLACAAVVGLIFITFKKDNGQVTQKPGPKATTTPTNNTPSVEETHSVLAAKQTLTFPKIASSEAIDQQAIPAELAEFVDADFKDAKFEKVNFEDGKTGYKFEYTLPGTVESVFNKLRQRGTGFQKLKTVRANLAAYAEMENPNYSLRLEVTFLSETQIQINVLVEKK